jgi:hypothetical protein
MRLKGVVMLRRKLSLVCLSALVITGLSLPSAHGQKLLGNDQLSGGLTVFTNSAGGACVAPDSDRDICVLGTVCPGAVAPQPTFGTLLGDVATNRLTNTIFVTDGATINEYRGDVSCAVSTLKCTPLDNFRAPSFMGPLTGMGIDSSGGTVTPAGTPVIWVTDGVVITGLVQAAGCSPPTVVSGPFLPAVGGPSGTITDVSWDPLSGTLWLCDSFGLVHNIFIGGGPASPSFLATGGVCGLATPLVGIAFDTATQASPPLPAGTRRLYVTDGSNVAYLTGTGAAAGGQAFGAPVTCTPTNHLLNGLALAGYGINYGTPHISATIGSFGHATSPGPTWGLELRGAPIGHGIWLAYNYDIPTPGYYCPSQPGVGTQFWVDPGPPGGILFLGTVTTGCMAFPLPLGPGLPYGLSVFTQFIMSPPTGGGTSDATNGLAFTIRRP